MLCEEAAYCGCVMLNALQQAIGIPAAERLDGRLALIAVITLALFGSGAREERRDRHARRSLAQAGSHMFTPPFSVQDPRCGGKLCVKS